MPPPTQHTSEQLLAAFFEAHPEPSEAEFEALCAEHSDQVGELRELFQVGASGEPLSEGAATFFEPQTGPAAAGPLGLTPGRTLGDFTLIQRLGRGGMGEVWEAQQEGLERKVALKLLLSDRVGQKGMDFFAREGRAGGRLAHPGIISVYGTGETEGLHWIAMELVEGACDLKRSLEGIRGEGELPEDYYPQAAEFIAEVADALEAAHASHVIHRDLKPGNIMVTTDDRAKVADFGLAKLLDEHSLSVEGDVVGTYYYMSPEQVTAKRAEMDHRTDIFSLGVVLYEMLTLVRPFEGDTTEQVAEKILWEDAPSPIEIRSKVPLDLAVICNKAMEKEPGRRYGTMAELAADLRRHLANEPIEARPSGAVVRLQKWVRRNPTKSVAAGVAAAALVVISLLAWQLSVEKSQLAETNEQLATKTDEAEASAELAVARADELAVTNAELDVQRQQAEEARDEATKRAEELQQVSDFQASQLGSVDPDAMGQAIRTEVLARTREAGERAGRELAVLEEEQATLGGLMAQADFTGIALKALDEQIFEGALRELESFGNQPLVQAQLFDVVGVTLRDLGLLDRALGPLEQAVEIRRRELGDEHPGTLDSINNLGMLFQYQGKYAEAEPLYREDLEVSRRTLGDEHPSTLISINNLGVLFQDQGKYSEAEALYREAVEVRRRTLGDEHPKTLTSINNLGLLFDSQGKYSEAEPLYREALEARRRTLGDEHSETLTSVNNLGLLFYQQGKYDDAGPLMREALEARRRTLGDEHPKTLTSISNMASLLFKQGKNAEGELLMHEDLEVSRRTLGDEHPSTLTSLSTLGVHFSRQGRFAEAEPLLREALETRRRTLGEEHPDTMNSINSMGSLFFRLGKYDEAEPLMCASLEGCRRMLGDEHPDTLVAINNLGSLFYSQDRDDEAESLMREALDAARRTLGDEHPYTVHFQKALDNISADRKAAADEKLDSDSPASGDSGDN